MRTFCIHIPREQVNEVTAIYETALNISKARLFLNVLNELHEVISQPISLEIFCYKQTIYFSFAAAGGAADLFSGSIYSILQDAIVTEFPDPSRMIEPQAEIATTELTLARDSIYPLSNFSEQSFESLTPLASVLSQLPNNQSVLIQLVLRPAKDTVAFNFQLKQRRLKDVLFQKFRAKAWFKDGDPLLREQKINEKCGSKLFQANLRIAAISHPIRQSARKDIQQRSGRRSLSDIVDAVSGSLAFVNTLDFNRLKIGRIRSGAENLKPFQERRLSSPFLLSGSEVSTLWHVPSLGTVNNTAKVLAVKGAPPKSVPSNQNDPNTCFFGRTDYRSQHLPFGIFRQDRRRHLYVVGKSGSGKSCLLKLLARNDILHGHGLAILDPHGDLVDDVLTLIPKRRIDDVVIIDPTDTKFPASFNPLAKVPDELRMRVTSGFVEIFRKHYGAHWSDRLEHVLRFAVLALLSTTGTTILSVRKMLRDDRYRAMIANNIQDEEVRRFWALEYPLWKEQVGQETMSFLMDRLGQFVSTDMVRNIVGQPINRFDFRELMDTRKIVLIKVSKGILGDETSSLFGAMVMAKIYQAAMSRADLPLERRQDFYLYVDEFHNFATDSFHEILSEARKYRLNITVANQFIGQLPESIKKTVFGNVGNILSFRVGAEDAAFLAEEFSPQFSKADFLNLRFRDFYLKMSLKGEPQEAFSGRTLDIQNPSTNFARECIEYSRQNYALPLRQVKQLLKSWEHGGLTTAVSTTGQQLLV